jgi:hypothetical protein
MRGSWLLLASIGLGACTKADDTDTDVEDTGGPKVFEDYVNTTDAPTGDLACYTGTWLSQAVDAGKVTIGPSVGQVLDFESDNPVGDATVKAWYDDTVEGEVDTTGVTDTDGNIALDLPICQPFTYETQTNPDLGDTVDTFEAHQIYAPDGDGSVDATYNSVSDTTYKLIPSLLGVTVDDDKGVIAGTAYDCDETPIEHAQVIVKDAAGNIPQSLLTSYFEEKFPTRDRDDTSADGLWTAVNVPEGDWTVEMYVYDEASGGPKLIGSTVLTVYPQSINISNIYTGFSDGVKYPAECLAL